MSPKLQWTRATSPVIEMLPGLCKASHIPRIYTYYHLVVVIESMVLTVSNLFTLFG